MGARDQRVTALVVSVLLGASVLMAPILKLVPFAVLFGVFLYMGISGEHYIYGHHPHPFAVLFRVFLYMGNGHLW